MYAQVNALSGDFASALGVRWRLQQGLGAGHEGGQVREGASRVRPLGHTVIAREADPGLQADGQASVVHRGLPGDRPREETRTSDGVTSAWRK